MNKCKTTRIILTFLICFNILGLETNFIFSQHETKNNFIFSQPDEKDLIRYGDGSFFIGGNGIATDVINWINISKAIEEHITDLETNTNNERIAIIDTGLDEAIDWINIVEAIEEHIDVLETNTNDERIAIIDSGLDYATWTYYFNEYEDWVDLKLCDYDGTYLTRQNAIDRDVNHHGTMITSLMIQLLESYQEQEIEAGITMFVGGQYGYADSQVIQQQLQRIIDWNDGHQTGKYKVISMSFGGATNHWADEIDELVNDQDCILISISGNIDSETQQTTEGSLLLENLGSFPAGDNDVFGVGGIYAYAASSSANEIYKMGTNISETTQDLYVGSRYLQDLGGNQATVDIVAPGFEIEMMSDKNNDDTVENYTDTGTSYACPQVAVAAYLTSRIRYKAEPNSPLTK